MGVRSELHNLLGPEQTPNTFDQLNGSNKIYVDTVSTRYLQLHYPNPNTASTTDGSTATHYPTRQFMSGGGATPAGAPTNYDDNESIAGATYASEVLFINGRYRTDPAYYINYQTAFGNSLPDYSGVAHTGYRYATFTYDLGSQSASYINYVDLNLIDHMLTSGSDGRLQNVQVYCKVVNNNHTQYNSIWLDANAILSTAVARSTTNYSDTTKEPLAVLENQSSNNTGPNRKRVVLVTGTPTSGTQLIVRIGLDMAESSLYFGRVEVSTAV